MKKLNSIIIFLLFVFIKSYGQDSTLHIINKWMTDNDFSIRQTFDGSKNENKPANFTYYDNHKSTNDFLKIDLAIKISQLELLQNKHSALIFYPKVEWHKSNDSTDIKNKLDGGLNFDFIPFGLKGPNLPSNLPNKGLIISPWIQGTSSFKRNFVANVYETKLVGQISLVSNYKFLPGFIMRDKKDNFRLRYYPYFGAEYNKLPDLITEGVIEEFSTLFFRLFAELWIIPQTIQLNIDWTYREIIDNSTSIKTSLPMFSSSINLYPGKQESLGVGFEYKNGYDTDSKFQLVQISSIKLAWKI